MDKWINGWMDGWMDGWMHEQMDGNQWMNEQSIGQINGLLKMGISVSYKERVII